MLERIRIRMLDFGAGYRGARLAARCAEEGLKIGRPGKFLPQILTAPVIALQAYYATNIWYREGAALYLGLHQGDEVPIALFFERSRLKERHSISV